MARSRIRLPGSFNFKCTIPVRITDINYGGHVGNDTVLSLLHEARMQFLLSRGYSELELEGVGLIMADASIEFRKELFYGETLTARVAIIETSKIGFDLVYQLEKLNGGEQQVVACAKTGMVCYDYEKKKICPFPDNAKIRLLAPAS